MSIRRPTLLVALSAVLVWTLGVAILVVLSPPAAAASRSPVVVSLTFDDATADQTQAAEILARHGMKATFYVNSGRIGTTGYLSWSQLNALADAGDEIGGHTVSHLNLPTLSYDDAARQVCDDRVTLLDHGFAVRSFAYPFGATSPTDQTLAADCGYNSARGVGDLVTPTSCSGCSYAETIPPANAYHLRTPGSVRSDATLSQVEGYVTQAEDHGGGWVPLVFHRLCTGTTCGVYSTTPALLDSFLTWLEARAAGGTTVRTVGDIIGGPVAPAVSGPAPTPTPSPPADVTPPSVTLLGPTDGSTVSGTVSLAAAASDASGLASVQILVDGVVLCSGNATPVSCSWDTTLGPDHVAAVMARAVDAVGNIGSSATMTYPVGNHPPVVPAPTTTPPVSPTPDPSVSPPVSPPASSAAVIATRASATLSVPAVVAYGTRPVVTVTTTAAGVRVPGARVTLFFRSRTAPRWSRLTVVHAGADGVARFTPRITVRGTLRAYVSGATDRAPAVAMRPVAVRMYAWVTTLRPTVAAGGRAAISVHLLPRHRGQIVVLQLLRLGRWVTVTVHRTDTLGRTGFRVVLTRRAHARTSFRIVVGRWGSLPGTKAFLSLRTT